MKGGPWKRDIKEAHFAWVLGTLYYTGFQEKVGL